MSEAVNDEALKEVIIETLEENYNYTTEEANTFVNLHGETIVFAMWDEFTNQIEQLVK